jgi:hypothetical protein
MTGLDEPGATAEVVTGVVAGKAGGPVLHWADGRPIGAPPQDEPTVTWIGGPATTRTATGGQPDGVAGGVSGGVGGGVLVRQFGLDDDPWEPPDPEGDADPDRIWVERPVFAQIWRFAKARRVAPWAVLANVLARVVAAVPPAVQLPPIIGSHASLNLFVGLVGPSGAGKDASRGVARDALPFDGHPPFMTAPLGSGEGLSHMFMTSRKPRDPMGKVIRDAEPVLEQYNTAALVTIGEIDTLGALVGRRSSTVLAQLRQAAMGEQLGFFYVDTAKRMIVPEHAYRLCLVAGIQPARAGVLLDDADGGTPQRFIWIPVGDREATKRRPPEVRPLEWVLPSLTLDGGRAEVKVCGEAVDVIEDAHLARLRGEGAALDGHALLTRLKVAAAVGILDGRIEVRADDWALSEAIMDMSDLTRARVANTLSEERIRANRVQAEAEAERVTIIADRTDTAVRRRVGEGVKRILGRVEGDGWMPVGALRKQFPGGSRPDRELLPAVLSILVEAGQVEREEFDHGRGLVEMYRIPGKRK